MASFDENGKYIKTNWKAGDKITATKLNKIEESIEAVNDNDISRHVEADARLDALEAKDVAHDKELTNVKNLIEDAKDAAELGDYEINSRMQFLEDDVEQAVNDMNNAVTTIRNEMNAHTDTINANVSNKISAFETEFDAEVAGLKAVDETIQNDVSEIQNDMNSAKTQTFTVTDAYKFTVDHDGMMPSLVTLDNIEGQSEIVSNNEGSNYLRTTNIKSICTVDTSKNYLDDATYEDNKTTHSIDGYNINVVGEPGWSYVVVHIQNLEIGNKYCITLDAEVTSGNSALEVVSGIQPYHAIEQCVNSRAPRKSANSIIVVYDGGEAVIRLHASMNTTAGNVTYKNIQINKVKEMVVPDIQLNSLPNGVKDEIKDGMLIKRTGIVNLADLNWTCSMEKDTFAAYYSKDVPNIKCSSSVDAIDNNILCNMFKNSSTSMVDASNNYSENIINSHWSINELKLKISKNDCPSHSDLKAWLTNNNVQAVYELAIPEYIPVNLNIKADKGDTVVINTTKTMDLTYDIQLNTRAQIDTLQTNINKHTHSEYIPLSGGNVTGSINPASDNVCDLGSTTNKWRHIYSHSIQSDAFQMYVEDNEYTCQLHCSRGNFRLTDGYNTSVFSWSHDYNQIGPDATNVINLGSNDYRFKSIHLTNNPNVSSDRTLKENIEYIDKAKSGVTYNDLYNFVKDDLGLATYNFINDDKLRMNFIAQDLLVNADGTDNKVGQMIVNPVAVPTEEEIEEGKPYPTLSYDTGMYTSVLAGALKEAINKIEQLEARINELENK